MAYLLVTGTDWSRRPEYDSSFPSWPYGSIPSAAQDCLAYGLQKLAHDVGGSGVLLIQDLHVPGRGGEVAVAQPMPDPLQVDALVDQPRGMRVPDLVRREPERQLGLLDRRIPDAVQVCLPMYSVGSRRKPADHSRSARPVFWRLRERP
jgi:hypothetical protein